MSPNLRSSHPHTTTHSNTPSPALVGVRPAAMNTILATAICITATKVLGFALEVASDAELITPKFGALLTVAATLFWGALGTVAILNRIDRNAALNLDRIDQHAAVILDRIDEAVEEAGDRRATAATLAALTDIRDATPPGPRQPTLVVRN